MQPIAPLTGDDDRLAYLAHSARRALEDDVLPFWLESGVDFEYGGFFTCFDNRGTKLVSTDKYSWSQGRFVAILAWAAQLARRGHLTEDPDRLLDAATAGAQFLKAFVLDDHRSTRYVVTRDGSPVDDDRAGQRSIYSDCFVAMGFAELAAACDDQHWLTLGRELLAQATAKVLGGDPPTAPYSLPADVHSFGPRMILVNAETVLARSASALRSQTPDQLTNLADRLIALSSMVRPDGRYDEVRFGDSRDTTSLLGRHQTPGHALEGLWMQAEARSVLGTDLSVGELARSALAICESGWDPQFGGLFRYVDRDNVEPAGQTAGSQYEALVQRTWDTKLWWVHAEACYCLTMLAARGQDPVLAQWRDRVWNYTFDTFPQPQQGPEWIQIRARDGSISDQVVALPLKDPYHITRSMMQLIELGGIEGTQQPESSPSSN